MQALKIESRESNIARLYQPVDPLDSMKDDEKVSLLKQVEQSARKLDSRISQVMVSLAGAQDIVLVARSDGLLTADWLLRSLPLFGGGLVHSGLERVCLFWSEGLTGPC